MFGTGLSTTLPWDHNQQGRSQSSISAGNDKRGTKGHPRASQASQHLMALLPDAITHLSFHLQEKFSFLPSQTRTSLHPWAALSTPISQTHFQQDWESSAASR